MAKLLNPPFFKHDSSAVEIALLRKNENVGISEAMVNGLIPI